MQYRRLGNSGIQISRLGLGTMTFGQPAAGEFMHGATCSEGTAVQLMDLAFEAGVNFLDTADVYSGGESETIIGRWLSRRGCRDHIVLASKFRSRTHPGINGEGASRRRIMMAVENSLRRLGTDRLDLYQIHLQDNQTGEDEILRALDDLVTQGKILYVGACNYTACRMMEALWQSDKHHYVRYSSLQAQYNLATRDCEREHIPLCKQFDVGLIAWSPMAAGLLSGKYYQDQPLPADSRLANQVRRYNELDKPRVWRLVEAVRSLAADMDAAPAQVALLWLLSKPVVNCVLLGCRTVEQLITQLGAINKQLTDYQVAELDKLSEPEWGSPYDFLQRVQGHW